MHLFATLHCHHLQKHTYQIFIQRKHGDSWSSLSQFYCTVQETKWENPEELEPQLELQLGPDLESKSNPVVNDPELDLEQKGDKGTECSDTTSVEIHNQEANPNKEIVRDEKESC